MARVLAAAVVFFRRHMVREAQIITVDADQQVHLPQIAVAGVTLSNAKEIAERVRSAIGAAGVDLPRTRHNVMVAPGCEHESTTALDLAVAVGLLASAGAVPTDRLDSTVFWGELALNGSLRTPRGALAVARCAHERGLTLVCPAAEVVPLLRWLPDLDVVGAHDLADVVAALRAPPVRMPRAPNPGPPADTRPPLLVEDGTWSAEVLTVAEAAVSARAPLLLRGPPGCGASMLAARLPGVMPDLAADEALEVATRASLAAFDTVAHTTRRPFRAPHSSVTYAGMLGEIELARGGVLLLSEVEFFGRDVLELVFRGVLPDVQLVCVSHAPSEEFLSRVRAWHTFRFEAVLSEAPEFAGTRVTTAEVKARVSAAWAKDTEGADTGAPPAP